MNGFFVSNPHSNTFDFDIACIECDTSKWKENCDDLSKEIHGTETNSTESIRPKTKALTFVKCRIFCRFTVEILFVICQFIHYIPKTKTIINRKKEIAQSDSL